MTANNSVPNISTLSAAFELNTAVHSTGRQKNENLDPRIDKLSQSFVGGIVYKWLMFTCLICYYLSLFLS